MTSTLPAPLVIKRDYLAEMARLIAERTTGTYTSGLVAKQLVDELRLTDPELLTGWLEMRAEQTLRDVINGRAASARTAARYSAPRSAFASDAAAAAGGDSSRLVRWLTVHFTAEGNTHKPLRDMTADDLLYAEQSYVSRVKENALTAAFLRSIAAKVTPGTTVADHYSDQKLSDMWDLLRRR